MSTPLALVRHGPTQWNLEKRVQGAIDVPLCEAGRAWAGTWRLPAHVAAYRWFVSPRIRARQTAEILGLVPVVEESLTEMAWGDWEGAWLPRLREECAAELAERERKGVDFRAPNGESPRDVQERLKPWLARVGAEGLPTGAVCHNGVIRALYALAVGWNMTGKPPTKLRDGCVQTFTVDADGAVHEDRLNIPLTTEPPP